MLAVRSAGTQCGAMSNSPLPVPHRPKLVQLSSGFTCAASTTTDSTRGAPAAVFSGAPSAPGTRQPTTTTSACCTPEPQAQRPLTT